MGIAAGRFGELSETDNYIAKARVKKVDEALARGEMVDKSDLSQKKAYIRRRMSQAVVIAFGNHLAGRMSQVGVNGTMASSRRNGWSREALWLERVQGRKWWHEVAFWGWG